MSTTNKENNDPSSSSTSAPMKKRSSTSTSTSTTTAKPRIPKQASGKRAGGSARLPNLVGSGGSNKKKSKKKKKKKKPIIEDPKLVRDMCAYAENNNVSAMKTILSGAEYEKKFDLNNTAGEALVMAAIKGHTDIIVLLLEHGGFVNTQSGKPLQRAALHGQLASCETLVLNGADVNSYSIFNEFTPLHYAAQNGSIDVVKFLIKHHAKIDATTHYELCGLHNGWSALHFAADGGHLPIVQYLIEQHADIDIQTADRETALALAAEHGRWDVVQWMVTCGANIHATRRGLSVVQWAIYRAAHQAIQFLVSYGAQPDWNVRVLWFPDNLTLFDIIKKQFSEPIYDQIDLAIYRGSLQVRERQLKYKIISEIAWEYPPVYDPYSFDPLPPPTIRTFPESIINLISAYDM